MLEGLDYMTKYTLVVSFLFDSILRSLQKDVLVGDECLLVGIWWWWNLMGVEGMDVHSGTLGSHLW